MVPWDSDTFLVIGADNGGDWKTTYFINMNNDTVTTGPSLLTGRYSHACHEMTVNGEEFIVVAGSSTIFDKSTEMLSKSSYTNGWKKSKN